MARNILWCSQSQHSEQIGTGVPFAPFFIQRASLHWNSWFLVQTNIVEITYILLCFSFFFYKDFSVYFLIEIQLTSQFLFYNQHSWDAHKNVFLSLRSETFPRGQGDSKELAETGTAELQKGWDERDKQCLCLGKVSKVSGFPPFF